MSTKSTFGQHFTLTETIPAKQKYALGLGFFALFFASHGISILAVPFYQMTLAVDPFLLSLAMTIPVLVASMLGPWIGHFSDNLQTKFGRRRPIIFISAWLTALCFGLIWMVPQSWSGWMQLAYFFVFSCLFNIFATFLTVPTTCLSYEITSDPKQRTQIMGITTYFLRFASLIYYWIFPLSQLAIFSSVFVGIQYIGWGVGLFLIGLLGTLPAIFIREKTQVKPRTLKPSFSLSASLKTLLHEKPLLILLLLCVMQVCGGAFAASFDFYLIVYYLADGDVAQGSILKGALSSSHAILGFLSAIVIAYCAQKFGKKMTLQWIFLITIAGGLLKWFIFNPNYPWLVIVDAVLCAPVWSAMTIIIPAMLADLADVDQQKTGCKREGMFVSLHNWVTNFSGAAAMVFTGVTLNLIGFNASLQGNQTDSSILTMRLILVFGTVIFGLICFILTRYMKTDR